MQPSKRLLNRLGVYENDDDYLATILFKRILESIGVVNYSKTYYRLRILYSILGGRKKAFRSHSIFGEDAILRMYLPENIGTYLDIGAGLPVKGSNTYFLYKRGWSGTAIDPVPSNIRKHRRKRPRDIQLQVGVSDHSSRDSTTFYEYFANEFSTNSEERVTVLAEKGIKPRKSYEIATIGLDEVLPEVSPLDPFLLDIDIEGDETAILEKVNWKRTKPRIICVEEWKSPIYVKSALRILLEEQGYLLASRAFITSIYVHREYLEAQRSDSETWGDWFSV